MRLDKYIATVTDYSRSEVKKLLKAQLVAVNGDIITDPSTKVSEDTEVMVEGGLLATPGKRYFMLYKPQGYICANKDRQHLTVMELIDEPNVDQLHVAGRLDIDTTGLVLLTDDGQWSHKVTSPKKQCEKTYYVESVDPIPDNIEAAFERGVWLEKEQRRTLPAKVERIHEQAIRLTITEGKYHQVKRMFHAIKNEVDVLHRERIGDIVLDENLEEGEYRALTPEEVASL